jgi:hypothetical protein
MQGEGVLGKKKVDYPCVPVEGDGGDMLRRVGDIDHVYMWAGIGECARRPAPSLGKMCGEGNIVQDALIGGAAGAYS